MLIHLLCCPDSMTLRDGSCRRRSAEHTLYFRLCQPSGEALQSRLAEMTRFTIPSGLCSLSVQFMPKALRLAWAAQSFEMQVPRETAVVSVEVVCCQQHDVSVLFPPDSSHFGLNFALDSNHCVRCCWSRFSPVMCISPRR